MTLLVLKLQSHDYAILTVLARLGLHGAEAAALRLGDMAFVQPSGRPLWTLAVVLSVVCLSDGGYQDDVLPSS